VNILKTIVRGLILLLIVLGIASFPLAANFKISLLNLIKFPLAVTNTLSSQIREVLNYRNLSQENKRLTKEIDSLTAQLVELKEASLENERLRGLLSFKKRIAPTSIPALVIGRGSSNWDSTLLINKGRRDGLEVNMPVISFKGIVGKTVEVGPSLTKVILITNPDFRIGAIVQRTREEGLIFGTANKRVCIMKYLPRESEVKVGDLVVSSGFGEIYPKGLLIGKVAGISEDASQLYKNASIVPAASLSRLEEVLVITGK
jgi:rod shape-determining protein MreC